MRNKHAIWVAALCAGMFCGTRGWADHITVSDAKVSDQATGRYGMVRFNVQWEHSWRKDQAGPGKADPYNYDAAWVFVKYRVGNGGWKHANLSTKAADHVVPSGCALSVGQTDGKGVGVFLYRSANGAGTFKADNVGLRWQYPSNGPTNSAAVEVRAFAIEMVYVTQGAFWVGDGNTTQGEFYEGDATRPIPPAPPSPPTTPELSLEGGAASDLREDAVLEVASPVRLPTYRPLRITNENALAVGDSAGQLYYSKIFLQGDRLGPIPVAFPKGYAAFYGMKYEITQGQYVDFLNTLCVTQATNRWYATAAWYATAKRDADLRHVPWHGGNSVSYERCAISNVTEAYTSSLPLVACGYLDWPNVAAYLDWAGLRPMTELEFEKACRGPLPPVAGEYAWGNTTCVSATSITNSGLANEAPGNLSANCNSGGGIRGPMRVGCMGLGTGSRTAMGAGYYGMMDLSGNLWERAVTVGNATGRGFTGLHGDGVVDDATGNANVAAWPVTDDDGAGYRGGDWYHAAPHTCVCNRGRSTGGCYARDGGMYNGLYKFGGGKTGGRGVRTAE